MVSCWLSKFFISGVDLERAFGAGNRGFTHLVLQFVPDVLHGEYDVAKVITTEDLRAQLLAAGMATAGVRFDG